MVKSCILVRGASEGPTKRKTKGSIDSQNVITVDRELPGGQIRATFSKND